MDIDSLPCQLTTYRGAVALTGAGLTQMIQDFAPGLPLPSGPPHITLLTKDEYQKLGKPQLPIRDCHTSIAWESVLRRSAEYDGSW